MGRNESSPASVRRVEDNRRTAVFGAGAVGGYLGGRFAVAVPSWNVTLVGRGAIVDAVNHGGLRIVGLDAPINARPAAVTSVDGVEPVPLVLLCVRGDDVAAAVEPVQRLLASDGVVVAVQNGVGTDDLLVRAFGRDRVVAGALTTSIVVDAPGIIERTSRANGIGLAPYGGNGVSEWLVRAFQSAGIPVTVVADPRSLRWSKLLLNMIGAPLSAILDMDIGAIMADPHLFRIEQLTFREATRVMDALGVRPVDLPGYPVRLACVAMRLPRPLAQRLLGPRIARARSGRSPGMRADLKRNRSEIETFHGAIIAAGARTGVRTPVAAALTDLVRDLVTHPARRAEFAGRPVALMEFLSGRGISL